MKQLSHIPYFAFIVVIVILIIFIKSKDSFQSRLRPISGVNIITKPYWRYDDRVRYEGQTIPVFHKKENIVYGLWNGAPGWGISHTWTGTTYRDNLAKKCDYQCDTRVPPNKFFYWLHGQ